MPFSYARLYVKMKMDLSGPACCKQPARYHPCPYSAVFMLCTQGRRLRFLAVSEQGEIGMSFRGINTTVIQIRRQVFTEVARMAYANVKGEQANHLMRKIPYTIIPGEEGKLRKQMREEVLKGLKNAVDPNSPDKLNFTKQAQPIVDAAYLVHAFLRAPKALWEPLDEVTKQRYIESFKALRDRTGAYNNWLLFTGLTEAFLMQQGEKADQFRLRVSKNKIQEWYVGDGWYSDGSKFSMDNYNSYVLNPMMVAMMETLVPFRWASQKEYEQALRRMVRHAEFCERLIGPDGTYPAFGRSVTYRTAAFQSLADAALREKLPEFIKPAQVRCALTAVHRNMYEGNQNFDKDGWLVLGFNGHQPEVADGYTSTGSLYMATLSFLPLGLPADNPFWTDEPADWTTKKAWKGEKIRKDYKVEY